MIVGNDISEHNGTIDWDTYKNNSNFVIIRSSYGNGYVDKEFVRNQSEARRVGLSRGYYHYCYPQYNPPESEVDWFLKTVNVQENELLCLDFEENYSGDKVPWCKAFLDHLQARLNGYKGLIYLNQSLATSNNWKPLVDAGYGLWIAAYTYDPNNNNFKIGNWKFAAMQQWTNRQTVPGIPTQVDGDVYFGDVNSFKKYGYHFPESVIIPSVGQAPAASPQPESPVDTKADIPSETSAQPIPNTSSNSVPVDPSNSNPTVPSGVSNIPYSGTYTAPSIVSQTSQAVAKKPNSFTSFFALLIEKILKMVSLKGGE